MKRISALATLVISGVVLYEASALGLALWRGRALAADSRAFERHLPDARKRLLVIGDSTAVGTGAASQNDSLAGRIGRLLPEVEIINQGKDGALTADLHAQMEEAPGERFDAILIQTGGNDILRFTGLPALRSATSNLLEAATRRSDCVVMLSTGDVGAAPAFPKPIDWIMTARTQKVRALFLEVAALRAVEYVDLYRKDANDPFAKDPDLYYADDGLHPSGAGYGVWFRQLIDNTTITRALSGA